MEQKYFNNKRNIIVFPYFCIDQKFSYHRTNISKQRYFIPFSSFSLHLTYITHTGIQEWNKSSTETFSYRNKKKSPSNSILIPFQYPLNYSEILHKLHLPDLPDELQHITLTNKSPHCTEKNLQHSARIERTMKIMIHQNINRRRATYFVTRV